MTEVPHLATTFQVADLVKEPVDGHLLTTQLGLTSHEAAFYVLTSGLCPLAPVLEFANLPTND